MFAGMRTLSVGSNLLVIRTVCFHISSNFHHLAILSSIHLSHCFRLGMRRSASTSYCGTPRPSGSSSSIRHNRSLRRDRRKRRQTTITVAHRHLCRLHRRPRLAAHGLGPTRRRIRITTSPPLHRGSSTALPRLRPTPALGVPPGPPIRTTDPTTCTPTPT